MALQLAELSCWGPHSIRACVCAQLCLTLCDLMDCSWPGSVHGIFRQECWSQLPFPPPGDLTEPEIKLVLPALAGRLFYH